MVATNTRAEAAAGEPILAEFLCCGPKCRKKLGEIGGSGIVRLKCRNCGLVNVLEFKGLPLD